MKKRNIIIFVIIMSVLVTATVLMWVFGPRLLPDWEYTMYGHMMGGWVMPFGMLGVGLFWLVVIYVVIRGFDHNGFIGNKQQNSIDILNKRLANGEITVQEYEEIKRKLKGES